MPHTGDSGDRNHVRRTFDRIASDFSRTRDRPWEAVERFLQDRTGDIALDLGCGNGRHAELLAARSRVVLGIDLSRGLLGEARRRAEERAYDVALLQGEATALPLRSECVDLAVYVATIHHLPTRTDRVASLDELARFLVPGGVALVSAWSTTHDRFDRSRGFNTTVDWTLPSGEIVPRFYHVSDPAEFREELQESTLSVVETFEERGNNYGIVENAEQ